MTDQYVVPTMGWMNIERKSLHVPDQFRHALNCTIVADLFAASSLQSWLSSCIRRAAIELRWPVSPGLLALSTDCNHSSISVFFGP